MTKSRLSITTRSVNLLVVFLFFSLATIFGVFFFYKQESNNNNHNHLSNTESLFMPVRTGNSFLKEEKEIVDLKWKLSLERELVSELRRRLLGIVKGVGAGESYGDGENEDELPKTFKSIKTKKAPIATVSCNASSDAEGRICRIKNLIYSKKRDLFFIYKDSTTLQVFLPSNRTYAVDLCTIAGHNKFYFDFEEVSSTIFAEQSISYVDRLTFMVSRFHAYNIMHTIHDDFLGLYTLHKMFAPPPPLSSSATFEKEEAFSKDTNILFLEGFGELRYDGVFKSLSQNPLLYKEDLTKKRVDGKNNNNSNKDDDDLICFRDAVVGNSKHGTWYTYGFLEPQGPIPNKRTSATFLEDAATFLLKSFDAPFLGDSTRIVEELERIVGSGSKVKSDNQVKDKRPVFITFISRTIDRLILNEKEVIAKLEERYSLMVKVVRMEDMELKDQALIIRNSILVIGAHGSALILGMFLPAGATLIELFPYAVPAHNYTPYKKMCELDGGSRLTYRSWVCGREEDVVAHPERAPSGGGIIHLEPEEQKKIKETPTVPEHLCCSNPYWLYRIYQDTKVNIDELFLVIDSALPEALQKAKEAGGGVGGSDNDGRLFFRAPVVEDVQAAVTVDDSNIMNGGGQEFGIEINWPLPWNGVKPTKYGVWVHQRYKEFFGKENKITIPCTLGDRMDFWVRSWVSGEDGESELSGSYSKKYAITCKPGEQAVQNDLFE